MKYTAGMKFSARHCIGQPGRRRRQLIRISAICGLLASALLAAAPSFSQTVLPQGGQVVNGQVKIDQAGGGLVITQSSSKAIINWTDFSIGSDTAGVRFIQPDAAAAILNRVTGNAPSIIAGSLTGNGHIYLVNPNGIAITERGSVDVSGGFIASTLNLSDRDFLAGKLLFDGGSGLVRNAGRITVGEGGYVALLGGQVEQLGTVSVPLGRIGLGAGQRTTLDVNGDGFLQVALPPEAVEAHTQVTAGGTMSAQRIEVRAQSLREAVRSVVNVPGELVARGVRMEGGTIIIDGGEGAVRVSGSLDASSAHDVGGQVRLGGAQLSLEGAQINASGTQGGTVSIGGGVRGAPVERMTTATQLHVDAGTVIKADGLRDAGGQVTLWSDKDTRFEGLIQARGVHGNGGEAEVSSHGLFDYSGLVTLLSEHGRAGTLLLDPYNVTISTAATSGTSGYTATGSGATINAASLQSSLGSASVTVSTGSSGAEAGDITLSSALSWSANTTLTLNAAGQIKVNAGITNSGTGSGVTLSADGSGIGGTGAIANAGVLTLNTTNASATGTLSGVISGAGSVVKTGPGDVTLSGANTFSGGATISAGSISIGNADTLGTAGSAVAMAAGATLNINVTAGNNVNYNHTWTGAGTLNYNVTDTSQSNYLTGTGTGFTGQFNITGVSGAKAGMSTLDFSNANVTISNSVAAIVNNGMTVQFGSLSGTSGTIRSGGNASSSASSVVIVGNLNTSTTFNGAISILSNAMSLQKVGTGTLTLGGTSNYTGTTTVTAGTLKANSTSAFGSNSAVTVASGATLDLGGKSNSIGSLAGAGTVTNSVATAAVLTSGGAGTSTAFTGTLQDGAGVLGIGKAGAGTLTLSGSNTYTGVTTVSAGGVTVGGASTLGGGSYAGALSVASGANFTFSSSANQTFSNLAAGVGTLNLSGSGAVTISGDQAFTGTLNVNQNTVLVNGTNGAQSGLGYSTAINVANATLDLTGASADHSLMGSGTASTTTITLGTGGVLKGGGARTFRVGALVLNGGTLTTAGALSGSALTYGTFNLDRAVTVSANSTISAGQFTLSQTGGTQFTVASGKTLSITGSIYHPTSGADTGLVLAGTGTTILSGGNTYTGLTTITAGVLKLGSATALGSNSAVTLSSGATLDLVGYATSIGSLAGTGGTVTNSGATATSLTTGGLGTNTSYSGVIQDGAGGVSLSKTGAGNQTLGGTNFYTGATTVSGGTLSAGATGALGSNSAVSVSAGATLDVSGYNTTIGSLAGAGTVSNGSATAATLTTGGDNSSTTYAGTIQSGAGTLGLSKSGNGTFTLSGVNTYTGTTTVNAGTLALSGSLNVGAGTAAVSVASGAQLSGAGTVTAGTLQAGGTGTVNLSGANQVNVLSTSGGVGALSFNNAKSLAVQSISASGVVTLTASGATSDLTLNSGATVSSSASGDAVVLSAGQNFINNSGASAVSAASGRWLIYSAAPTNDILGGLNSSNGAVWNASYASKPPGSVSQSGNRYLFAYQPTVTFTSSSLSKTYGQNATSSVAGSYAVTGVQSGVSGAFNADTAAIAYSGTPTVTSTGSGASATASGGPYTVSVAQGSLSALNGYALAYASSGQLTVNKALLTVTANNASRAYNGQAYSGGNGVGYAGFVNGETSAVLGGTLTHGGTSQGAVNAGSYAITVSGLTSGNYTLSYVGGSLTISKAALTIGSSDVIKTYDGTTTALGSAVVSSGTLYASDSLSGGNFAFTGRNAGTGKTVTVSGVSVNDGNSGGNYNVSYANNTSSTINQATLTVSSADVSKTYDGTLAAAGTAVAVSGLGTGDTVTGGSFAFTNVNAGTNKTVSVSGVTVNDGNSGLNYQPIVYQANNSSTINKAALTVSTVDVSKTYDGTTSASGTAVVTSGTLYTNASHGGVQDALSGGSFAFANRNAGSGKTVTVSGATVNDGNSGGNYNVTYASSTGSTIGKATLTVSSSDVSKAYDGTLAAAGLAVAVSGLGTGDTVTGGTFAFTNANAGTNKTVSVSGVTVNDGNSGLNYLPLVYQSNTSSSINKAALTVSSASVNKTYDGTTVAAGSAVVTAGTLYANASNSGAQDSVSGGSFAFANRNAGTGKTVTVGGVTVNDGHSGGNYDVTYASNTTSSIGQATLTVSSSDVSKTYDGTLAAAGTAVAVSGLGAGDAVSGGSFAFTNANAGSGRTVAVSGVTVSDGNGGSNYQPIVYQANTSSTINKAALTVSSVDVRKTYDGTTTASGTAVVTSGTLYANASHGGAQDSVSGGSYAFTDRNAGTSKTVTVSGVTVNDGNMGGNYNVSYASNTSSIIDKATLTVSSLAVSRAYDGSLAAAGSAVAVAGLGAGDTLSGGNFAFTNANAGTGKTVTVSGVTVNDGQGGLNYQPLVYQANTSSTIDKAALTLGSSDVTKTYDGTTTAAGTAVVTAGTLYANASHGGVQDTISGGTFAFTNRDAGAGKTVTASGVKVGDGNNGGNYNVSYASNTNSTIAKATLTVSSADVSKIYDGTLAAAGTAVAIAGLGAGDVLSGGSFAFTDANAGTGKTVTASGVTVNDGHGGLNYQPLVYQANTTSIIGKAALTISSSDVSKTYDGTTTAAGTAVVISGTLYANASHGGAQDALSGGSFAFANRNAGTGKTVTVAGVTVSDGHSGGNYDVTYTSNTTSSIGQATLTVSSSDVSKTYDGTLTASGAAVAASGLGAGDALSGGSFAFTNANAGTGKTVTVGSVTVNDGNNGLNYLPIVYQANTTSTINKAALTLSSVDVSKTYDGTTTAAGTAVVTAGTLYANASNGGAQDAVSGGSFAFADRNAGTGKTVTVGGITVSDGHLGGNYDVSYADNTSSAIGKATLTVSSLDVSKTYDGSLAAAGSAIAISGLGAGDTVSGGSFVFSNANAGTGKTVTVSGVTVNDGNSGLNYQPIAYQANTSSTINKAALTISSSDVSKTYDGTTTAAGTAMVTVGTLYANASNSGAQDAVSGGSFAFTNRNAGAGKAVTVSDVTVGDGNNGGNYEVTYANNTSSVIGQATLTVSSTDVSRTYDGTLAAAGSAVAVSGLGAGDALSGGSFVFTNANAGTGKTVTVSGVTINDGHGGLNYQPIVYQANTSSTINKAALTISSSDVSKTYDGTTIAAGTAVVTAGTLYANASQGGTQDTVGGGSFVFTNRNAGTGKAVTVSGVTLGDGNNGGNYDVTYANNTSSVIGQATLTVSSLEVSKTYDGTLAATGSAVAVSGLGVGDALSGGSFAFSHANAGTGKTVTVSGVTVNDGHGGLNYLPIVYQANASSVINRAALTVSSVDVSKTYDGTTIAAGTAVVTAGTLYANASNGGAQDTISGGSFAFANRNAGAGKTVTVGGVAVIDGHSGGNYDVTYANNTTSSIGQATLTVSSADVSKTYDGTLTAAGSAVAVSGLGASDSLGGGNFAFTNANAGTGKDVTVSGVTVNDGNGGLNYQAIVYQKNISSTINKAALTISSSDVGKTYDGTTSAAGNAVVTLGTLYTNASHGGMQDAVSGGSFAFTSRNAGTGKTVTVDGVTVNDGNSGGNYDVTYASNTTSIIGQATLTVSSADVSKTYDGTLAATGSAVAVSGLGASDSLSGGNFAFTNANAGTGKTVTVTGVTVNDGNGGLNYQALAYQPNTSSTINKAALTIGSTDVSKTYDGTSTAFGTAVVTSGTLYANASHGGAVDALNGGSFTFDSRHAGSGKTVTVSGVTVSDGNAGGNYDVSYASNTSSRIDKATLTVSSSDVIKTYDGTLSAAGTALVVSGLGAGDSVGGGSFAFTNANAGAGKTVTVNGVTVNDGNGGLNYQAIVYQSNTNSVIEKAALTLSSADVAKTYDGTISAAGSVVVSAGTLYANASHGGAQDTVSSGHFAFADRNAGTGKTVTVSGVTINDGNSGGNYDVSYASNTSSVICQATLTVSAADLIKTYDGTLSAAGTAVAVSGLGSGDSLSGGHFAFANANAGAGKVVTVGGVSVNDGNSGLNYQPIVYQANASSTINKAALTITTSDVSKTYDGTTVAAGHAVLSAGTLYANASNGGVQDAISGGSFAFANRNAGTGKTVTVSGVTVNDGNSGGNYDVSYASNTSSAINQATLTVSSLDVLKTYDGTLAAAGSAVAVSGLGTGDTLSGGSFAFTNANAGTGKTVTVSGVTVHDGNGGLNYQPLVYQASTSSTIQKAALTITTSDVSKTYDGTSMAAGIAVVSAGTLYANASSGGAQDTLSGGSYAFADRNAGTGKAVTVSGVTVNDGNAGGNYDVTYATNTTSNIGRATLTVSSSDVSKTYDGTVAAAGAAVALSGLGAGDVLSGGSFAFTNANAGTGKTVAVSSVTVNDGHGGLNYEPIVYQANTSSTINKAALTISTSDVNKTYDGTTTASGAAVVSAGTLYASDTLTGGSFNFDTRNAGGGKTVTVSGVTISDGNGGGNYAVGYASNTSSSIGKATLTVSSTDVNKTYDGTRSAAGAAVAISGLGTGDTLNGGSFAFTNANAGTGKTVTVSGVTVQDGNSGSNYLPIVYVANASSTINKAALTISSNDVVKTYDGSTFATGSAVVSAGTLHANASNGGAKDVISGGSFAFANRNAGSGKIVTVSGVMVNDGNSGGNYDVTYASNTTSNINKAVLTVSSTNVSKAYDGTLAAAGTAVAIRGLGAGDALSGGSFAFTNANVGTGKTVTVSGVTVQDGNGGLNYQPVVYQANTSSIILPTMKAMFPSEITVAQLVQSIKLRQSRAGLLPGLIFDALPWAGPQDIEAHGPPLPMPSAVEAPQVEKHRDSRPGAAACLQGHTDPSCEMSRNESASEPRGNRERSPINR